MNSPQKPLTPARKAREVRKLQQQLAMLQARPAQTPCAECQHFLKQSQQCLSWGSRVPEDHVGLGCERFLDRPMELLDEDDDIPF